MRSRRPLLFVSTSLLLTLLWACEGAGQRDGSGPQPAAAPERLEWPRMAGADRYELRVWSGNRLVFQSGAPDTVLALTPVQRRAMAAFDTVEVVVRGLRRGERVSGAERRWRIPG